MFPPEKRSSSKKGAQLYKMLRPELVRKNKVPLSSDACTAFGVDTKHEHDDV